MQPTEVVNYAFVSFCHSGLSVPVVPNLRAAKDNNREIILKGCLMVIRVGKNKYFYTKSVDILEFLIL